MFSFFRKKTKIELLIEAEGIERASEHLATIVAQKIPNAEIAYQFILEELDGARMGNTASQTYARNSGISEFEYRGALNRSNPDVDGPDGPQQLLARICLQLSRQELMADLRCRTGDKIMQKFKLGKYADTEDWLSRLLQNLKDLLVDDKDVMPALTSKIPVPAGAQKRHISNRERNIAAAKDTLKQLKAMTGSSTEAIIERALNDAHGYSLELEHVIARNGDSQNYTIMPEGFKIKDHESGDELAAIIKDGMFHGAVLISDIGAPSPLAPWPVNINPFEDDLHFCGSGMSPQGPWSFSIRPSAPFSQILREAREQHARTRGEK